MPKKFVVKKKLTSQELNDLGVEIGFLEALVRRDARYVDALQLLGDDYTRAGRFDEGLSVDEQLAQLRPDDALVHYNLACSYSLTARCDAALAALERAVSE